MGLRNTLEPDPDNTGVGSFLRPSGILPHLTSLRKLLCFRQHRNEGSLCTQALSFLETQSQTPHAHEARSWLFSP
ncbi:hypothetical protein SBA5_10055 [Candidatus Sulfotelmatomonas gaucii]|uniref:Uncharacterized protein n=1 Tax=Candidatus Sulfuritelmatomonas gaucii TaxID=2043161 RepID=A0A2N9L2B7_9BACT|nr:hypothetical protein SBA5_10055 [Candidatus Sulfotelmatomonas gaucii]